MTFDWSTQRAKLNALAAELEGIKAAGDAEFNPPPSGVIWSETGVVNSPALSSDKLSITSTGLHVLRTTVAAAEGYARVKMTCASPGGYIAVGLIAEGAPVSSPPNSLGNTPGGVPASMYLLRDDGVKVHNLVSAALGSSWAQNGEVRIAWKNGKLWFGLNSSWHGDPEAGTGEAYSGLTGNFSVCVAFMGGAGRSVTGIFAAPAGIPAGFSIL